MRFCYKIFFFSILQIEPALEEISDGADLQLTGWGSKNVSTVDDGRNETLYGWKIFIFLSI